ncbi:MAG TPA: hypothetical protein VET27_23355 [Mycobacterium sp.]|nr:hypothetical protein [Mycobacterium sp.]
MATCNTCGNHCDNAFTVTWPDGRSATFDGVECAAAQLAPECAHCARKDSNADVNDRYPAPKSATQRRIVATMPAR